MGPSCKMQRNVTGMSTPEAELERHCLPLQPVLITGGGLAHTIQMLSSLNNLGICRFFSVTPIKYRQTLVYPGSKGAVNSSNYV